MSRVGGSVGGFCEKRPGAVLRQFHRQTRCRTQLKPSTTVLVPLRKHTFDRAKHMEERRTRTKKHDKEPCQHQSERIMVVRRCSRGQSWHSPADYGETMMEQLFPCSPWRGTCQTKYPHFSPWRTPQWSMWVFPEGTVVYGKPMLEQLCPEHYLWCSINA